MKSNGNKLSRLVSSITRYQLPSKLESMALSLLFNSQVKMAWTSGIQIHELKTNQAKLSLSNKRRIQNHIGGIHACGMALLAESATGVVFGMNVSDTSLPLLKRMTIEYKKVVKGDLNAIATLSPQQIAEIEGKDKGEICVDVKVTDSNGNEPIQCEMIWAWVPKVRKSKP